MMNKSSFSLGPVFVALLLALFPCLLNAEEAAKPLDAGKVPLQGSSSKDFVPAGWALEREWKGDLNGDGRPDDLLGLLKDEAKGADGDSTDRERALVVLIAGEDGKWKRVGVGNQVFQCYGCGGMLNGSDMGLPDVAIDKGVVVIEQDGGSRYAGRTTLRFRYDPESRRMRLIGADWSEQDRMTGKYTEASTNYLTGERHVTRSVIVKDGVVKPISDKRTQVPTTKKFLEEVNLWKVQ